jgi:uncharacterized membrane protein YgdD (TMEM256/DUF423 family)
MNGSTRTMTDRLFVLASGLTGAAGVALSAAAAHAGGGNTATAASFLLMHAPVFLAIGLAGVRPPLKAGAAILLAGLVVFAADLLLRDHAGTRFFPMAAPLGGTAMIAGWLAVAVAAFVGPLRQG